MRWIEHHLVHMVSFAFVGILNTLLAFGIFAALVWCGLHYALATLIGGSAGVILGFRLHGRFVFMRSGKGRFAQFVGIFLVMYGLSIGIQSLARTRWKAYVAGAIASCITIPISYGLNRIFVFQSQVETHKV